jgi:hypothetical protein
MSDSTRNRGEPDRSRISLSQSHEVSYWTSELGVSEAELRRAVESAGNSVEDVRRFLRRV